MDTHDPRVADQTDAAIDVLGPWSSTFLTDLPTAELEEIELDAIGQMTFLREFRNTILHAEHADFMLANLQGERDLVRCELLWRAKRAELGAEDAATSPQTPEGVQRREEIRRRLGIVEFVVDQLSFAPSMFRPMGESYLCPCPLPGHQPGAPSLYVNATEQTWCCIGCDQIGDLFSLFRRVLGLDGDALLEHLATKAGLELG